MASASEVGSPSMASEALVEAAALGDLSTISAWTGDVDVTVHHPKLPTGCTLLMAACSQGKHEVVRHLLTRGANVNLRAAGGVTALLFAATAKDSATVKLLCEAGASLDAVELGKREHVRVGARRTASTSHTALEVAEANGDSATVAVLNAHREKLRRDSDAAAAALLADESEAVARASPLSSSSARRNKDRRRRDEKRERLRRERVVAERGAAAASAPAVVSLAELSAATVPPAASNSSGGGTCGSSSGSQRSLPPETVPVLVPAEAVPAALSAARRRGAMLHGDRAPEPPPPPPSTPIAPRRSAPLRDPCAVPSDPTDPSSSSSSSRFAAAVGASSSTHVEGGAVGAGAAEMETLEARAAAKAAHMAELDARCEARGTNQRSRTLIRPNCAERESRPL
jgi:hypothetical protein